MPMNAGNLGDEIKGAIEAAYGKPADDPAMLQKFCDAIAEKVVAHLIANLTITFAPGDIPVTVSGSTHIGANTAGAPLTGKVS